MTMSKDARSPGTGRGGFTLFEVLIALAVFMLAVIGLSTALDSALQAALEVRQRSQCRQELESCLAYCQVDLPGDTPRILEAETNNGMRVEESVVPYPLTDGKGREITGLKKLTITTKLGKQSDHAEILIYRP
jgi:type II secretory pathway component PulJ